MSDHVEDTDFPVRPIALTLGLMLLALIAILGGLALIYRVPLRPAPPARNIAHGPDYCTAIETDRQQLAERFEKNLTTPRWIDRQNGIVAIPIDQAIKRIAADGELPTWPPSDNPPAPRERPIPPTERRSP